MPDTESLSAFLRPTSVAFIGASSKLDTYSGRPLAYTRNWGYAGKVFVVNPTRDEVAGVRSYRSVGDIEEPIDLAVLLLSSSAAVEAVRECAVHGVKSCLVIASGFAEAGEEGAAAQKEMADIAREHGMRLVGPNSAGIVNLDLGLVAKAAYLFREPFEPSGLAFITQSGSLSTVLLMELQHLGVSVRYVVDTGNEADVTAVEVIAGLLDDPGVRVIAGYLEAFSDGEELLAVGRRALRAGVPLLLLTPANPLAISEAVASHTGALVKSSQGLRDAVFRQAGILATPSTQVFADAIATSVALDGRPMRGNRVGIVSGSGGAGILLADSCLRAGLRVDPVSAETTEALAAMLPSYAGLRNPIDITGSALDNPDWFERAAKYLVDDDGIDCVILNFPRHHGIERVTRDAQAIVDLAASTEKPIVAITVRTDHNQTAIDLLRSGGVPVFVDNEICAWVLSRLAERAMRLEELTIDDAKAAHAPLPVIGLPTEATDDDVFSLLSDYGLPVAPYRAVAGRDEAVAAAGELGFPVALKVLSSEFSHKTEAGGVRLGLADADALAREWDALSASMGESWSGHAIVQAMSAPGLEVVVGLVRHSDVGPVVMVGAGGTLVEVLGDVAFAGLPLSSSDIDRLIDSTALSALIRGVRGSEALDRAALVDVIAAAGRMFANEPLMSELDLNPVILRASGASIVDALVVAEKEVP